MTLKGEAKTAYQREYMRRRRTQTLTAAAAVLFAIVASGAIIAEQQAVRAQHETERRQVNLLAELTSSQRLQGNLGTALRLGVHAARSALALDQDGAGIAAPRTALAAVLWQSDWRLLRGHEGSLQSVVLQPRRDAHRHRVRGQDRAHLGCRDRQGDRGPAARKLRAVPRP